MGKAGVSLGGKPVCHHSFIKSHKKAWSIDTGRQPTPFDSQIQLNFERGQKQFMDVIFAYRP